MQQATAAIEESVQLFLELRRDPEMMKDALWLKGNQGRGEMESSGDLMADMREAKEFARAAMHKSQILEGAVMGVLFIRDMRRQ